MNIKSWLSALCLGVCTGVFAIEMLPGGFTAPSPMSAQDTAILAKEQTFLQIRKLKTVFLTPDSQGVIAFQLENRQIGKYVDSLDFSLKDPDGKEIHHGTVEVKETRDIHLEDFPAGVYSLTLNAGANSAVIRHTSGRCFAEASAADMLHLINTCPKLYFLVNGDRLQLDSIGEPAIEHVALNLYNADGDQVATANSVGNKKMTATIDIPVPPAQKNRVWSLKMGRVPNQGFEDMYLKIRGGANTMVSYSPNGFVVPLTQIITDFNPDGTTFSGITVSSALANEPDLQIDYTFTSLLPGSPLTYKATWKSGNPNLRLGMTVDSKELTYGQAVITVRQKDAILHTQTKQLAICEGKSFQEIPYTEPGNPAIASDIDEARGFQVFQRDEPGFVRLNSRPADDEVISTLNATSNPGLISAEYLAVYPLKDRQNALFAISDLKNDNGDTIPKDQIQLLTATIWPQRTDWNSLTFINAPELLEDNAPLALRKGHPQQLCVRVAVPKTARPGVYRAKITLDGAAVADYELTVNAFQLPEYHDVTFGLYPDCDRWVRQKFTDDEVLRELRMFRDYGMNALMLYPFSGSEITYDGKQFHVNFDVFRRHARLYWQVGFPGVAVISLQAINPALKKALKVEKLEYSPVYEAGFKAVLDTIRTIAAEDHWGNYCIHTVDEPNFNHGAEEAVRTLKLVKSFGFKTFNTCYGKFVREFLAPFLDYRCYNNIAFSSSKTKKDNDSLRKEALDDGDDFWWYGSGCYTNGGLQQDCNVYTNRHMLGIFTYRSRTTGAWTWTFLRAKGDVYNDFDGNNQFEAKEACIAYPARQGNGLITTLQWEACREGVYDYRYIRLWDALSQAALKNPAKAALAQASRTRIQELMDSINWHCLKFSVSNTQLRELRQALIEEINKLN